MVLFLLEGRHRRKVVWILGRQIKLAPLTSNDDTRPVRLDFQFLVGAFSKNQAKSSDRKYHGARRGHLDSADFHSNPYLHVRRHDDRLLGGYLQQHVLKDRLGTSTWSNTGGNLKSGQQNFRVGILFSLSHLRLIHAQYSLLYFLVVVVFFAMVSSTFRGGQALSHDVPSGSTGNRESYCGWKSCQHDVFLSVSEPGRFCYCDFGAVPGRCQMPCKPSPASVSPRTWYSPMSRLVCS